jgi:hypothetical protein
VVLRSLPDFLIVGAMRGGTTSLSGYLELHPDVAPATRKEVHYFDLHFARGEEWYRSHFPPRVRRLARRALGRPLLSGDASPYYLFHPLAPERAAALVPDARIVALLRDPVTRALSHYRHAVGRGAETLPPLEAFQAEPERLAGEEERLRADPAAVSVVHRQYSYLARGDYAVQLERWFAHYPRERVLVLASEELFSDPADAYARTLAFLGLRPHRLNAYGQLNPVPEDEPPDEATVAWLRRRFAEPNERLFELLGRRLPWPQD